ncbi:MAG: DUF6320 domain-containing protein [bacterium]
MKHCDKCNVDVKTNFQYCPLCHQVLAGENDPDHVEIYPECIPSRREVLPLTKKILLFITTISIVTLFVVNLMTKDVVNTWWSLIPIGGILYFWAIVRYGILSRQNIAFKLAFLTTTLILILNLIDQSYGDPAYQGWALEFVTPLALLACNLAISFIIWLKRINHRDYIVYLLTIIVFSLVPLFLVWIHVIVANTWPAIAAFVAAMFILLVVIFFFPKSIKEEIHKRFHF